MMNDVKLMGRLGKDVELNKTQTGYMVYFNIAVDKGKDKEPEWIPCKAWDKTAEFINMYLGKGCRMIVSGRIATNIFEKNGEKRVRTEVHVGSVEPIDWKNRGDIPTQADQKMDIDPTLGISSDDLPF